jgi:lysophospholipid acyltransferase (LPLAT)-like uncharacterized protein
LLLQKFAGLLAGFLYKNYAATFRYELHFEDESDRKIFFENFSTRDATPGKNLIYACFHQDDLSLLPFFANLNICVLISQSKDGQILASAVEHMGYQTVRGSSHRGGVAGLLAGMRRVMEGHKMTIAVDGPKGPIYKVKEGITAVADKSRRPIVPVRGIPQRKQVFEKSWNKATLPLPFTRIDVYIGKIASYNSLELENKLLGLGI